MTVSFFYIPHSKTGIPFSKEVFSWYSFYKNAFEKLLLIYFIPHKSIGSFKVLVG